MIMNNVDKATAKESLGIFNSDRKSDRRYASFDYCFNYFQSFKDRIPDLSKEENLQQSCLHPGFFLASWGMYRPSSFLLQKSMRHLVGVIEEISNFDQGSWDIDVATGFVE